MKNEQINIAIAKECGWHSIDHKSALGLIGMKGPLRGYMPIPDYCNNLNAIHEAEKILTPEEQGKFADNLFIIAVNDLKDPEATMSWFTNVHTTARQRAEALLRTVGKWIVAGSGDTPDSSVSSVSAEDSSSANFMETKKYSVEPHGAGYAVYQGRDQWHHGHNLGMLTECDSSLPSLIETALNRDLEAKEVREEMRDKIISLEFKLKQEQQKNAEHERDYLAVWKAVKEPNETVVQAVRRVVLERDKALLETEAGRHCLQSDVEEIGKRKIELEEALERIGSVAAHGIEIMRPFSENFSPLARATITEIRDIANESLHKKESLSSDGNATGGLPVQDDERPTEEDSKNKSKLNDGCGILDLLGLHLRNIRDSSASGKEVRAVARTLLVCYGLDEPRNEMGKRTGAFSDEPGAGEKGVSQIPEDGK